MGNPREPAQPGPADSRRSEAGRDALSPLPGDRPATRLRRRRKDIRSGRASARTAHPGNADTNPRGARHRAHLAAYCGWKRTLISVSRFVSSFWPGCSSVVCPCIAVWGLSQQRVIGLRRRRAGLPMMSAEITDVSMPRRARPGRQLCIAAGNGQAASVSGVCRVPCVAMAGSQAWPVVMTACRCRKIAAAMTVCAWAGVSLFCSRLVGCA
jgi:hypothetical protein